MSIILGNHTLSPKWPASAIALLEIHDAAIELYGSGKLVRAASLVICSLCPEVKIPIDPERDLRRQAGPAADALLALGYRPQPISDAAFAKGALFDLLKERLPLGKEEIAAEKKDSSGAVPTTAPPSV